MVPKRKMELEDITNRHKKAAPNKDVFVAQQRLPLPQTPACLLPHKARSKLVQFELSRNQHYELPLLTPKDDDDDEKAFYHKPEEDKHYYANDPLGTNPDYIALCLAARVLGETRGRIEANLERLARMREEALLGLQLDVIDCYVELICNGGPQQHRIMRCPLVDWGRYHQGLGAVSLDNEDNERVFRGLNVFGP